jgi:hypothetical protein
MPQGLEPGTLAVAAIDVGAREKTDDLESRLKALELVVSDLSHSYWGDSTLRNNGERSRLRRVSRVVAHLTDDMRKGHAAHKDNCFGIAELDKHLEEHDAMSAREVALEVAKIQAQAEKSKSKWKEIAAIVVAILMLGGQSLQAWQTTQLEARLHSPTAQAK